MGPLSQRYSTCTCSALYTWIFCAILLILLHALLNRLFKWKGIWKWNCLRWEGRVRYPWELLSLRWWDSLENVRSSSPSLLLLKSLCHIPRSRCLKIVRNRWLTLKHRKCIKTNVTSYGKRDHLGLLFVVDRYVYTHYFIESKLDISCSGQLWQALNLVKCLSIDIGKV